MSIFLLYQITPICSARSLDPPRNPDFIRKLRIKLIWYNNVSLIKTRCRASRRGEVFSPVGVRLPNPYENVHLCLEFAIYQTHVIIHSSGCLGNHRI